MPACLHIYLPCHPCPCHATRRHYANSLVKYTTGLERGTQRLKRLQYLSRHQDEAWLWHGWLIGAGQVLTDVGNWGNIKAGAAATLLAVSGTGSRV